MSYECLACGKKFGGVTGFDAHRTGKMTNRGPGYGRRCLSADELMALGMSESDRGVWKMPAIDNPWAKDAP